jgi:hypothetical protein
LSKGEKRKEPQCRDHPSFKGFVKFQKKDEEQIAFLREYIKDNRGDFCDTCGLNMKFTDQFFASHQYEALVISKRDCTICGRKDGKICDVFRHQRYHRKNCLKKDE